MPGPHPALIELAAGRPMRFLGLVDAAAVVSSAFEHRVAGLLWTEVQQGAVVLPRSLMLQLAREDLRQQSIQLEQWRGAARVADLLGGLGIGVVMAKGVAAERRWYGRMGERPSNDVDLMLEPGTERRLPEIVEAFGVDRVLHGAAAALLSTGVLQSIDIDAGGVDVDLHADIFKVEIPIRQLEVVWGRRRRVLGPEGLEVDALDPELSLVQFLLHLTKDRFARLLGFVDVARILAAEDLDWDFVHKFVRHEGLEVVVYRALDAVVSTLGLPRPPAPAVRGLRAMVWDRLWPETLRLRGRQGLHLAARRQLLIPLLARGRIHEAAWWWLRRRALPPAAIVNLWYPDVRGPYLLRLLIGRLRTRRREALEREAMSSTPTWREPGW